MAQALFARRLLAFIQADVEGALRAAVDAEARARCADDRSVLVWILTVHSLAEVVGNLQAAELCGEADAAARQLQDPAAVAFAA